MALLRAVLRFGVENGHIPSSPTDRLGRGKLMLPLERPKMAPPIERAEDVGRLLAAIREIGESSNRVVLLPIFAVLVYTGLRRGEVLGLRWTDVDLDRRIVTVRRSYDGPTKSSRHRTVPMAAALVSIMKEYRLRAHRHTDLVFTAADGSMYSRNSKLEDVLHAALDRICHSRIRVHDLRHVYASHFVMCGGDIFTLQRILGHSTPQLTSDTYAHLSPGHLASEADRVSYPAPDRPAAIFPFNATA